MIQIPNRIQLGGLETYNCGTFNISGITLQYLTANGPRFPVTCGIVYCGVTVEDMEAMALKLVEGYNRKR